MRKFFYFILFALPIVTYAEEFLVGLNLTNQKNSTIFDYYVFSPVLLKNSDKVYEVNIEGNNTLSMEYMGVVQNRINMIQLRRNYPKKSLNDINFNKIKGWKYIYKVTPSKSYQGMFSDDLFLAIQVNQKSLAESKFPSTGWFDNAVSYKVSQRVKCNSSLPVITHVVWGNKSLSFVSNCVFE